MICKLCLRDLDRAADITLGCHTECYDKANEYKEEYESAVEEVNQID